MFISAQSPEGAKAAGGWHVSAATSVCTLSLVVTVPRLSYNFAMRLEWALGVGRGQTTGAGTFKPAGTRGFLGPQKCRDAWV